LWIESSGFPQVKAKSDSRRLTFKKDEVIQARYSIIQTYFFILAALI
jgi:hypothetical protein